MPLTSTSKHAVQAGKTRTTLETYAGPTLGQMPVDRIDTELVLRVLQPIWDKKIETASRVRGRIENVLSWARVRGFRSGDDPARWRGHLDQILPSRAKIQKVKHHPALSYEGLPEFVASLRQQAGMAARALEFTILTVARTSQVIEARRAEFGTKNDLPIWVIPADRMKSDRDHRVPVVPAAIDLIHSLPSFDAWVFEGQPGEPLSTGAMSAVLKRMERTDITVHGFRSTFRDWCFEETSFPREIVEAAMAHSLRDKAEAAYRRGDALERRRELMEAWAYYAGGFEQDVRVVPIRG